MARPLALADTCLDKRWRSKSVEVSQHGGVTEAMLLGGRDSAQGQEIPIRKVDAVFRLLVVKAPRTLAGTPTWRSAELVLPECKWASTPGLHFQVLESLWAKGREEKGPQSPLSPILPRRPTETLNFSSRRFLLNLPQKIGSY